MIDAHTHLDFPEFDADRDAVVQRARDAGVRTWVICGSRHDQWAHTEAVAAATGGIAWLGVHPWSTADGFDLAPWLDELVRRDPPGIGEFGLDSLHAKTPQRRANQRSGLRAQLALAREQDKPIALHCVRAYPELVTVLERDGVPAAGGMVHAWSGPAELVERVVALGLHVSFAPLVLHDRAKKARASVPHVPDERLLIETDCPDMKPRGVDRGEPAHTALVAAEVARLRGQSEAHVRQLTDRNAAALLGL